MQKQALPRVNQRVDIWFDGYEEFYGGRVESVSQPYTFHVILDDNSSWNMDTRKHIFRLSSLPPTESGDDSTPSPSTPTAQLKRIQRTSAKSTPKHSSSARKSVGSRVTRSRRSSVASEVVDLSGSDEAKPKLAVQDEGGKEKQKSDGNDSNANGEKDPETTVAGRAASILVNGMKNKHRIDNTNIENTNADVDSRNSSINNISANVNGNGNDASNANNNTENDNDNERDPPSPPLAPLSHTDLDTLEAEEHLQQQQQQRPIQPPAPEQPKQEEPQKGSPNQAAVTDSPLPSNVDGPSEPALADIQIDDSSPSSKMTTQNQSLPNQRRRTSGRALRKNIVGLQTEARPSNQPQEEQPQRKSVSDEPSVVINTNEPARSDVIQQQQQQAMQQDPVLNRGTKSLLILNDEDDDTNIISDSRPPDPTPPPTTNRRPNAATTNNNGNKNNTRTRATRSSSSSSSSTPPNSRATRKRNLSGPNNNTEEKPNVNNVGRKRRNSNQNNSHENNDLINKKRRLNADEEEFISSQQDSQKRRQSVTFRDEVEVFTVPPPKYSSPGKTSPGNNNNTKGKKVNSRTRTNNRNSNTIQLLDEEESEGLTDDDATGNASESNIDHSGTTNDGNKGVSSRVITALAVDAALHAAKTVIDPLNVRLNNLLLDLEVVSRELLNQKKAFDEEYATRPQITDPSLSQQSTRQQQTNNDNDTKVNNASLRAIPKSVTIAALQNFQLDVSEVIGGGEARLKAHSSLSQQEFSMLHRLIDHQSNALKELDRLLYAAQGFSEKAKEKNIVDNNATTTTTTSNEDIGENETTDASTPNKENENADNMKGVVTNNTISAAAATHVPSSSP